MTFQSAVACIFLLALTGPCFGATNDSEANPIRRVVVMLQKMVHDIEKETDEEKALYDKFMCYCKNNGEELESRITSQTDALPKLQSIIEQTEADLKSQQEDFANNKADLKAAKQAMSEATGNRDREQKKFAEDSGNLKGYLSALGKAIPAIEQGMSGAFIQTDSGAKVREAIKEAQKVSEYDRGLVYSFLSGKAQDDSAYNPSSGEITGILKQMEEDFQENLTELEKDEAEAVKVYKELMKAKGSEFKTLVETIEAETLRIGDLKVAAVTKHTDKAEVEASLKEDKKLAASLKVECDAKPKEWEVRKEQRSEELTAIHETIKILNDDDALDMFKKTLPSPSLLQMESANKAITEKARLLINALPDKVRRQHPALNFIALALAGKKVDFSNIIKMIDDMKKMLGQEEAQDAKKKDTCNEQFDLNDDKIKENKRAIKLSNQALEQHAADIAEMQAEIEKYEVAIKDLDAQVAAATTQRKAEHAEYLELVQENTAAKEILSFAETRLNKFYNPKLYKKTLTTTPNPDDAFLQISQQKSVSRHMTADEPSEEGQLATAPEGFKEMETKGTQSQGVIELLQSLAKDLDLEVTEAKTQEDQAQSEYELTMNEATTSRAASMETITSKEAAKAEVEVAKATEEDHLKAHNRGLQAVQQLVAELHNDCDWLIENFDLRIEMRQKEITTLEQAKSVLQGADFSFVQLRAQRNLRGQ